MDARELANLLGLAPTAPTNSKKAQAPEIENNGNHTHVFVMRKWDQEQGNRILAEYHEANELGLVGADALDDLFHCLFTQKPAKTSGCLDKVRQQFIEALLDTDEHEQTARQCRGNLVAADLAAIEYARQLNTLYRRQPNQNQPADSLESVMAAVKAAQTATNTVNELEDAVMALGMSGGGAGGGIGSENADEVTSSEDVRSVFQYLINNHEIRKILALAGKYRRAAQTSQRRKKLHGSDEVVGIHLDGDLNRVLPSELAALGDDELELVFLKNLVERQVICREMQATQPQGLGPVLVYLDESSSMEGDPTCHAKAFALAMAWIAKHQKRDCCLVAFSSTDRERAVTLPRSGWSQKDLLDWLDRFLRGGTSGEVPFRRVFDHHAQFQAKAAGKVDVIVVTDGQINVTAYEQSYNEWKKANQVECKVIAIDSNGETLRGVADEIHSISELSANSPAVVQCFQI